MERRRYSAGRALVATGTLGLARNNLDFWTPNRTSSLAASQSPNPHCSPLQLRFGSIGASKYKAPLNPKLSNLFLASPLQQTPSVLVGDRIGSGGKEFGFLELEDGRLQDEGYRVQVRKDEL